MKPTELLKKNKAVILLAFFAVLGIVLLNIGDLPSSGKDKASLEYTEKVRKEAKALVEKISGKGAYVTVTVESMSRVQYAVNVTEKQNGDGSVSVTEEFVTVGGAPVVLYTGEPVIRGITVVCRNGDNASVQKKVIEALSCAFGISSARICVVALPVNT